MVMLESAYTKKGKCCLHLELHSKLSNFQSWMHQISMCQKMNFDKIVVLLRTRTVKDWYLAIYDAEHSKIRQSESD